MRRRCRTPSNGGFSTHGARGIAVCERWESFEAFLADMGPRPSAGHSVDRIDGTKGYEPGNCRWATRSEQNRNTRRNHRFDVGGESITLTDLATRCGLRWDTLLRRIERGWDLHRAMTTPVDAACSRAGSATRAA